MTQPNLLELARQGNIDAIASVINYVLQDKGITVKVFSQGNYLEIIAETNSIPKQKKVVAYIQKIITQVKIDKFNKIKISGKRSNTNTISWSKLITLDCKEVNFSKNEQQNQSKISTHQQWLFWFPYPSSWLRALVLILIAFPGASLICLGFGGMLLSTITNSLKIFIFFAVFGLLLPTLIFSGIYYLL